MTCGAAIDTMAHVLHCPAYQSLRTGKDIENEKDVVKYYMEVIEWRSRNGDDEELLETP